MVHECITVFFLQGLWDFFVFRGCDYTVQNWSNVHEKSKEVLQLYKTTNIGEDDVPGTSAIRILEYIVRLSGWICEMPDPSVYRACYDV